MAPRWGKAERQGAGWHRLEFHCLDVAAVLAEAFEAAPGLLDDLAALLALPEDETRGLLLALLALHDVGKVSAAFQYLRPDIAEPLGVSKAEVDRYERTNAGHDAVGYALLHHAWKARGSALLPLIAAATGHHGVQPSAKATLRALRPWLSETDEATAATLIQAMTGLFGWMGTTPAREAAERASYVLNGLFSVCDWLGSDESVFRYRSDPMPLHDYWTEVARPGARTLLAEVGLHKLRRCMAAPPLAFADLFAHLGSAVVATPLQDAVDCAFRTEALPPGPLLVILEDAPGAGKTEAGDLAIHRLIAAGRASGFYCGLPTMATADGAYGRKKPVVERLFASPPSFVLAHARRHLNEAFRAVATRAGLEAGEGEAQQWFVHGGKRALLSEAGVGTIDQALMGALRNRHAPVRLWGLWRKVLLVDEVHAYDDYMTETLKALLRHHAGRGDHAILMSATLPSRLRGDLIAAFAAGAGWPDAAERAPQLERAGFPLLGLHHAGGSVETPVAPRKPSAPVTLRPVHDAAEVVAQVAAWAREGRCVIWFRNTVDDAIDALNALTPALAEVGAPPPLLFHARFLPGHRSAIERAVLDAFGPRSSPDKRRGRVLVATQVAEQSLDLDFDEWVSDLAPPDSILQRLGRRRRHARTADGARLAPDAVDQRPVDAALLLMPPLEAAERPTPETAGGRGVRGMESPWYAILFRRASAVYVDDAELWLGALHLTCPETIPHRTATGPALHPGDDARPLLESVYATDDDAFCRRVPPSLLPRHRWKDGSAIEDRRFGLRNTFGFREGLLKDWRDGEAQAGRDDVEERLPTRLGDSHSVILARRRGPGADGAPAFLDEATDGSPAMSTLSVRHRLRPPPEDAPLLDALRQSLPPRFGRLLEWTPVVFLEDIGDGRWAGLVHEERPAGERKRRVGYDRVLGFRLVAPG